MLWAPELHRSATVTAAALAAATSHGPDRHGDRARLHPQPDDHRAGGPRPRRALRRPVRARARHRASSGSTRTGTTSRFGKPVAAPARDGPQHPAVLGDLHHRRADRRSTASTSRCASAATSARSPCPAAAIPVYLAAMGPLMTAARRRDRRRLDQPTSCARRATSRERILPDLTAGIDAGARQDPRRPRRRGVRVLLDRRRSRRRAAPRGRARRVLRVGAHVRRLLRLPRPGGRPAGGRRGVPRRASAPDDLADAVARPDGRRAHPRRHAATTSPRGSRRTTASPTRSSSARPPTGSPAAEIAGRPGGDHRADRRADREPRMRPLEDVRIVAVEQYGAGPFGSVHLADLGARGHQDRGPAGRAATSAATCRRTPRARTRCSSRRSTATSAASRSTSTTPAGPRGLRGPGRRSATPSTPTCAATCRRRCGIRYDDLKHLNPRDRLLLADRLRHDRAARARARLRLRPAGPRRLDGPDRRARRAADQVGAVAWSTTRGGLRRRDLAAGRRARRAPRRRRHGLRREPLRHRGRAC